MMSARTRRRRVPSRPAILFGLFAVVAVATGVLSPHFAWEHLPISAALGQTLIVLADFVLLAIGFAVYVRSIRREERERRRAERNLISSYRYIGVANRRLELLCDFVDQLSAAERHSSMRETIASLLPELVVPFVEADLVLLRIIDLESGQTCTEWWHRDGGSADVNELRVGNREVIAGFGGDSVVPLLVEDRPDGTGTVAILAANRAVGGHDGERFLRTAIRLLHLSALTQQRNISAREK